MIPTLRVTVALLLVLCATEARSAATLEATDRVYDAGKVDRGATLRHEFVLRNVGTEELAIDAKPG